jgi:hypothetical protein
MGGIAPTRQTRFKQPARLLDRLTLAARRGPPGLHLPGQMVPIGIESLQCRVPAPVLRPAGPEILRRIPTAPPVAGQCAADEAHEQIPEAVPSDVGGDGCARSPQSGSGACWFGHEQPPRKPPSGLTDDLSGSTRRALESLVTSHRLRFAAGPRPACKVPTINETFHSWLRLAV